MNNAVEKAQKMPQNEAYMKDNIDITYMTPSAYNESMAIRDCLARPAVAHMDRENKGKEKMAMSMAMLHAP